MKCESCGNERLNLKSAVLNGKYYKNICAQCLGDTYDDVTSSSAGYDRRRNYEDHAQDTVQPYNANGANAEFLRLYPERAKKVFTSKEIEQLKRKI